MPLRREDEESLRRNFTCLALHQLVMRIGWIFKTETVVIPAFMDFIGGGPLLRGCLPVLNRFGFAVPPAVWAGRLKAAPLKKWKLVHTSLVSAIPFLILSLFWSSGLWRGTGQSCPAWMPWAFLLLYALFFCVTGMNQLAVNTLQGKLIPADMRGRLFASGTLLGAPLAILAASLLMPRWMARPDGGFGWVFGVSALMFFLSAVVALGIRETPDPRASSSIGLRGHLAEAISVWHDDLSFRRLVIVASLFSVVFMIFPHYQAVAREALQLERSEFMIWVCAQNVATMLGSLTAGLLADRYGNRIAIQGGILGSAVAPLLAISLASAGGDNARACYWVVYVFLGLTPVTIKLLANYTLEVVTREHHPRYVSTLGLALALPVMAGAPLVGCLVRVSGYLPIFLGGGLMLLVASWQSLLLDEPRQRKPALGGRPGHLPGTDAADETTTEPASA